MEATSRFADMRGPYDHAGDVEEGQWVYIDARPYRPMIGRVESKMPGFIFVNINIGSRYRKGRTIPVPEQLLQPHKVHRLQIQSVTGPLPEMIKGQDAFSLFTDKPEKYPDFSHPDNKISFDGPTRTDPKKSLSDLFGNDYDDHHQGHTSQIDQAKQALGIQHQQYTPDDTYSKARDFLMGGRPHSTGVGGPVPIRNGITRQKRGNLGY